MPTKILGFGHYKQSGKSSICDAIVKTIREIPLEIIVSKDRYGQDFVETRQPKVNVYSFADKLKQFCQEVLGLTWDQCYGTDEDKQSLTHLLWENMPGVIDPATRDGLANYETSWGNGICEPTDNEIKWLGLIVHKPGPMTAREVLQHFGTGICRRMYSNCWVDATMRQIKKDAPDIALIPDMRFPNEADAIKLNQGATIKFLRRPFPDDDHPSEISLDKYKFDFVFDNQNWTIERKDKEVIETLKLTGWLP